MDKEKDSKYQIFVARNCNNSAAFLALGIGAAIEPTTQMECNIGGSAKTTGTNKKNVRICHFRACPYWKEKSA